MSKSRPKKLQLTRETVKPLSTHQLDAVAGGRRLNTDACHSALNTQCCHP